MFTGISTDSGLPASFNNEDEAGKDYQPSKSHGQIVVFDPVEKAASFGRWQYDSAEKRMGLSAVAACYLETEAGWHSDYERCFARALPEDMPALTAALEKCALAEEPVDCEFRIIDQLAGMRWLRMVSLFPEESGTCVRSGLLIDVSAARQAAIRERLSYESAQFLVGTHTLEDALTKVIKLVCQTLGWEWGAYWALESGPNQEQRLSCKCYWHDSAYPLAPFIEDSVRLRSTPGSGLIGRVWQTGKPSWNEYQLNDGNCLRRNSVRKSGLLSGYAFPVAYQMPDGQRHSPGVLEFFSSMSRQHEAQLPNISLAIGTLVAETVQRLEQMETINRLAHIDDLTGLANRSYFHQLVNVACSRASRAESSFGLLYIDLDRFKPINDVFGHEAGNAVLREFGQRLNELMPSGCQSGRLGGDEFAVLSYPIVSSDQLKALAERVLAAASRPFFFDGNELSISASIGISLFPENGASTPELMRCADAAMYRSKNRGRNGHCFFSSAISAPKSSMRRYPTMESALHHALREDQFFLEYQPVFDGMGEKMIALEALIRWRTQSGEIIRPDIFIPIAEKSFLIGHIDRWVAKRACRDLAMLHRSGFPDLQVNVNMTASDFLSPSLAEEMTSIVHAAGLSPRHLCLELTENMVMQHAEKVVPVMQALRRRGFHLSLDDFGTGHSSLSRLNQLPISSLKIDRSFVSGLPDDAGARAIVRTIFDLGHHMKLQIIAEGIETDAQMGFLSQFGYPWMQGFLLGRPMPADNLISRFGQK